jgi:hypothetical protein
MYRIFDLCMTSNLELPELEPSNSCVPDIDFLLCTEEPALSRGDPSWLRHWRLPDGGMFCSCGVSESGYVLRFYDMLDFHVSTENCRIRCAPTENIPASTVRHLLVDQVVPRLLGHRGNLVVHGSAVVIDGQAVAFVGESGMGKSTLAAYLHQQGHEILTDDCFSLKEDISTGISLIPNYPGVRLFGDSSAEVLDNPSRYEVAHYTSKKRILLENAESQAHLPLSALFFLSSTEDDNSQNVVISPVPGIQRIMKLVQCSFGLYGESSEELRTHFLKQGHVAKSPLAFMHLQYPRRYDLLQTVHQRILDTMRTRSRT